MPDRSCRVHGRLLVGLVIALQALVSLMSGFAGKYVLVLPYEATPAVRLERVAS